VPDELDRLFATPPSQFIEERKRIAAALKSAGRKDDAKAVDKIPRPSVPVWTVNQIARREPELVRRLGAITERLKVAAGSEYAAAATEHRQVLGELRERAAALLVEAGHDAGPHNVQRVVTNLRAAAGNAETLDLLARGRLERDLEEQEAASLFGTAAAASGAPAAGGKTGGAKVKTEAKTTAKSAADAKAEERARAKEIAAAAREVERLRDDAAAARKDAERAERAVAAAQEALAAAEAKLAEERKTADAAVAAVAEAEAALARLA
jgi:hypothetical protein